MRRARLIILGAFLLFPSAAWSQGPVGPEFRVNTFTTSAQRRPSVATDASGNFVVVWASETQDGSDFGIFGQRYSSAGLPIGPEFRVNSYTTGAQTYPHVASDASGNFVVAWESDLGDQEAVFGQRFAASGSPLGAEFRVNTLTVEFQAVRATVTADSSGNFVVVWTETGLGFGPHVFGQRYDSSGSAVGAMFRVNTYTTAGLDLPAVAMDPVGNFVVAWSKSMPGAFAPIFGRRFASTGAPLGPEFRVNTSTPGYLVSPDVAVDASGNFVVVWDSTDSYGTVGDLFGQRYAGNGMPVGPEFQIATSPYIQFLPSLRSDAAGNFVVVWLSEGQDGSSSGVFGQRYASDGAPLGTEFRINTHTTGAQSIPVVAADPAGNFVVVWQGVGQDGSSYGVFGQRYRPIVPVELMRFGLE